MRMDVDDEDASRGRKRVFQNRDELSKASSTHNHNSNPSVQNEHKYKKHPGSNAMIQCAVLSFSAPSFC